MFPQGVRLASASFIPGMKFAQISGAFEAKFFSLGLSMYYFHLTKCSENLPMANIIISLFKY